MNLNDFYRQMKKFTSLKQMLNHLPGGLGKQIAGDGSGEREFRYVKGLLDSMTPQERAEPQ